MYPVPPRIARLVFVTAAFELILGLAVFAIPTELGSPSYADAASRFPLLPIALMAGAVVLLVLMRFFLPPLVRGLLALLPAAPLAMAASALFAAGESWAPLLFAPMAVAILAAPWLSGGEAKGNSQAQAPDALSLLISLVNGLVGAAMLMTVPAVGVFGLAGAAALLLPFTEEGRKHPHATRWAGTAAGAVLPVAMAGLSLTQGQTAGAIAWSALGLGLLACPDAAWIIQRTGNPGDLQWARLSDSLPLLERTLELWTWGVALGVVLLSVIAAPGAVGTPLTVIIFTVAVAAYNILAHWVFRSKGSPQDRIFLHLAFTVAAVGFLLDEARPMGNILLVTLAVPPALAARALGLRRGMQMLALTVLMPPLGDLRAWLLHDQPPTWQQMLAKVLLLGVAGGIAVRSSAQQRDIVENLTAAEATLERQVQRLELLSRTSQSIRRSLDLDEILSGTAIELGRALNVRRCAIRLREADGRYRLAHQYLDPRVALSGVPAPLWNADLADTTGRGKASTINRDGRHALVVPILADSGVIGAICLEDWGDGSSGWAEDDLAFVVSVGEQLAVGMVHARVHHELQPQAPSHHTGSEAAPPPSRIDPSEPPSELKTQQRQLQEALEAARSTEEMNSRLAAILEATPDMVSVWDTLGRGVYLNRAGRKALEVGDAEARTLWLGAVYPPWARPLILTEAIPTAMDQGMWSGETSVLTQSGAEIPVSLVILYHPLPDGRTGYLSTIARDISRRKQSEERLRESEERFRGAFDHAAIAMALVAPEGRLLRVNPVFCELLGRSEQTLTSAHLRDLAHGEDWDETASLLEDLRKGTRKTFQREMRFLHQDGVPVWTMLTASLVRDGDGDPLYFISQVEDIGARKRSEAELMRLANYDPLTELYNRRRFQQELERAMNESRRYGTRGALLFLDLDQFKYINDSLGHQAGDDLLISISSILRHRLRTTDVIARLGGDEFAVLLPHADGYQAKGAAEQILGAMRGHLTIIAGQPISITCSIGVALFPDHAATVEELLARADLAMYQAKEAGRNSFRLYSPDREAVVQMESRLTWERRIRDALENDLLVLLCHPIFDLRTLEVTQYELLLRMQGEDGSLILPGAFLDVAERFGLMHDIDRWVVRRAIRMIRDAREKGHRLCLQVNLSGKAFTDRSLIPMIEADLTTSGIDPSLLVLEIAESAAVGETQQAYKFVSALKQLGCRLALDDFGRGFSSFHHLRHLPVDYLKIDGGFISNLQKQPEDQSLVKAMVEMAHSLGKETIAESVGDDGSVALLKEWGVNYAQGYHLGRPFPVEKIPVK